MRNRSSKPFGRRCSGAISEASKRYVCLRGPVDGTLHAPLGATGLSLCLHLVGNGQTGIPWRLSRRGTRVSEQFIPERLGAGDGDKAFGTVVRRYWTQFAKTGNPNHPGMPDWPAYNTRSDQVLTLDRDIRLGSINPKLQVPEHIMAAIMANKPEGKVEPSDEARSH